MPYKTTKQIQKSSLSLPKRVKNTLKPLDIDTYRSEIGELYDSIVSTAQDRVGRGFEEETYICADNRLAEAKGVFDIVHRVLRNSQFPFLTSNLLSPYVGTEDLYHLLLIGLQFRQADIQDAKSPVTTRKTTRKTTRNQPQRRVYLRAFRDDTNQLYFLLFHRQP